MEEAKAAILGYGAATTIKDRRTLQNAQSRLGTWRWNLVPSCWEEKGLRGSQGQPWKSDQHEGEKRP